MRITSCSNGQKTAGFCSFLANFSQLFCCRLAKRYIEFGLLTTGKGDSRLIRDGELLKLLIVRVNLG
ncbi:hypothetical protein AE1304_39600 [Aeromonas enteropelogenes]